MVQTTVKPWSTAIFFNIFTILKAVEESRPLVGSSQSKKCGSVISSYPMLVLLRSPPEIPFFSCPPIQVFWQCLSPSLCIISWILSSISQLLRFVFNFEANLKHSRGVNVSSSTSSCYTNAPIFPKSFWSNLLLLHFTSPVILDPLLNPSLWPRTFKKDVFPLPLAPMIAISCPGFANPFKL